MKVKTSWRKEKQSEEKGKRNVDLQDPFFFFGGRGEEKRGKGISEHAVVVAIIILSISIFQISILFPRHQAQSKRERFRKPNNSYQL